MADFPTSIHSPTNPTSGDTLASVDHALQHQNHNGEIVALETKLGTGSSTPASNTFLVGTGSGTSAWQSLTSAQLASRITDETGSGSLVFGTAPTLTSPVIATSLDMNGLELILDADGDTSITADTDDQIDIRLNGADDFQFTPNTFSVLGGSTLSVDSAASLLVDTISEKTSAAGVTIDGVLIKDSFVYGGGVLGAVRTYTSSDTWTKPTGLEYVIVEVVGGGGGGGGSGATNSRIGAGGAGGGYSRKKIAVASLGATETVTIGAAGTAGTSTGSGGNGGNTTFGSHLTGAGGTGGGVGSGSSAVSGPAGGAGSSGDLNITGGTGGNGGSQDSGDPGSGKRTARGGDSRFGHGGVPGAASESVGGAGIGYGAGGAGGGRNTSSSSAGGAGTAGLVIVYEYY